MTEDFEIQVKNVYKSFQRGSEPVLNGVSIDFPKGKLTYILGSSGAGKSVLIRHILGLVRPDRGEIIVSGKNLRQIARSEWVSFRLKFGMLFQNAALFDDQTVYENVAFPLVEHTSLSQREIKVRVKKTLSLLGMEEGLNKFPNQLSGGMRKRVGLARAIIREPSILLYDEPTTGLDPVTCKTVDELIATLKRELKLTSVVISHDIPSALLLADYIGFLDRGKMVFFGTPSEFRRCSHSSVQKFMDAERRILEAFLSEERQ
jgi:phospholipid/cholesterol/gamma-HCH transport system ATP-binding protein